MSNSRSRFEKTTAYAGWIIAAALAVIIVILLPRLRLRVLERPQSWGLAMAGKKADLASIRWEDSRPISVWLGDSHVELGNWYDLFNGAYAIRNCGMAMATIDDVARLVESIPDNKPEMVVIMCGVNSLYRGATVGSCEEDFSALLKKVQDHFHPRRVIVLAVMPVRQNPLDPKSASMNHKIFELNRELSKLCAINGVTFVDVNNAVADENGALDFRLTQDGLHLNNKGYRAIAAKLRKIFADE